MIEISGWVLYGAWVGGLGLYCRSGNWKLGVGNGVCDMVIVILYYSFLAFCIG